MKVLNPKAILCLAAVSAPLALHAADQTELHHHWAPQAITRVDVIERTKDEFAKVDLNHDGFITTDEVKATHDAKIREFKAKIFDRLDTNHDGVISRDEFMADHHDGGDQHWGDHKDNGAPETADSGNDQKDHRHPFMRMAFTHISFRHLLEVADANHDGKLSLDEVLVYRLAKFDTVDTNHDGVLSSDEMKASFGKMRTERLANHS